MGRDIIGLFDRFGVQVVSYTYDTWGRLEPVVGLLASTVGEANPYRYRGYRYDTETGLYYLQSRYYNPEWGRFVNSDDVGVLGLTQGELLTHNLFAYGLNDPVNNTDEDGYLSRRNKLLIGALVAVAVIVVVLATGGTAAPLLLAAKAGTVALKVITVSIASKGVALYKTIKGVSKGVKLSDVTFTMKQLQAKFKHAGDFGIKSNWNTAAGGLYQKAIKEHINTATDVYKSTYRGQEKKVAQSRIGVLLFYNKQA